MLKLCKVAQKHSRKIARMKMQAFNCTYLTQGKKLNTLLSQGWCIPGRWNVLLLRLPVARQMRSVAMATILLSNIDSIL